MMSCWMRWAASLAWEMRRLEGQVVAREEAIEHFGRFAETVIERLVLLGGEADVARSRTAAR